MPWELLLYRRRSGGAPLSVLLEAYLSLEQKGKLTVRVFEEVQAARRAVLEDF